MIDYDKCAKFIIRNAKDANKLTRWGKKYFGTKEQCEGLKGSDFFPLGSGIISFAPQQIYFTFERIGANKCYMEAYNYLKPGFCLMAFEVEVQDNMKVQVRDMAKIGTDGVDTTQMARRGLGEEMLIIQERDAAVLYSQVMLCFQFGAENVVGKPNGYKPSFSRSKSTTENRLEAVHMIRKTYTLTDGEMKPVRHHRSPDCEFDVKGHVRHYKSGKTVYIKPFTKGVGKKRKEKVYVV